MENKIDSYFTIADKVEGLYKEKGSKFYCYLSPISNLDSFEELLKGIKKEHPKARHFCYAYKLGIQGKIFRINDDGEPSGTAGKPIYGQLNSKNISDVSAVVVRYFGGTKLGASGLIRAYKTATEDAIERATITEKILKQTIKITFDYAEMGTVLKVLKDLNINLASKHFEAEAFVTIEIRNNQVEHTIKSIKGKMLNRSIEDIEADTLLEGCKIEIID